MRACLILALLVALALASSPEVAPNPSLSPSLTPQSTPSLSPAPSPPSVPRTADPVLRGVDVVAYFSMKQNASQEVMGNANFSSTYRDFVFHFSSAENKALFDAHPEQYSPAYGGFCAYAISEFQEMTCVQPDIWYIVGGRLYMLCSKGAAQKWLHDLAAHIAAADKFWIKKFGSLTSGPFNTGPYCPQANEGYFHGVPNWAISVGILAFTVVFLAVGIVWMRMRNRRLVYESIY